MTRTMTDWLNGEVPSMQGGLGSLQQLALDRLNQIGIPHSKMEDWLYIDVASLLKKSLAPSESVDGFESFDAENTIEIGCDGSGFLVPEASVEGVRLTPFSELSDDQVDCVERAWSDLSEEDNAFVLSNMAGANEGLLIQVDESVQLESPVHLRFLTQGEDVYHLSNVVISLASGAQAKVLVSCESAGGVTENVLLGLDISDESELDMVVLQEVSSDAVLLKAIRGVIGNSAKCRINGFFRGLALSRWDVQVDFVGENSFFEVNGLAVLEEDATQFNRTRVRHRLPHNDSSQLFKSVLNGVSLAEYNGLVVVDQHAQKSDSIQSNQTLLLSDKARMLSRPQLQIHADDVKAAHGANVGQLDDAQLFYLKSRGLSDELAKRVLMTGFVSEVVDKIECSDLKSIVSSRLEGELYVS